MWLSEANNNIDRGDRHMNMLVVKSVRENPINTHVILGREDGHHESRAYFTRSGGYDPYGRWYEESGHYNMNILEATKDFEERIKRGF